MPGEDLYQMLGLDKSASQAEIKKAYYKLALQWHPDRYSAPEATAKFQALQRVYDVLSDPQKRQVYDRTGSLQDCEDLVQGENFQELYEAFREALKVTEEDIDTFSVTYRGSEEERGDLLRFYVQFGGDMARVFDWLMLSRPELDSHRFRDSIEAAITAGEVKRLKPYKAWAAKVASTPPPSSDPLAPPPKKKGKGAGSFGDELALVAAIKNKQNAYSGMLAALEAKYAGGSSKGKAKGKGKQQPAAAAAADSSGGKRKRGKAAAVTGSSGSGSSSGSHGEHSDSDGCEEADQGREPTEEEFAAARAKLLTRTKGRKAAAAAGGSSKAEKQSKQAAARAGKGKAAAAAAAAPAKKQRKQKA